MTQNERVLKMLQEAGDRGLTNHDFLDARISRFGARLDDLRRQGWDIPAGRWVARGKYRYKLLGRKDKKDEPDWEAQKEAIRNKKSGQAYMEF